MIPRNPLNDSDVDGNTMAWMADKKKKCGCGGCGCSKEQSEAEYEIEREEGK